MIEPWLLAPVASIISILIGIFLFNYVNSKDAGTDRMKEIAEWIQEGSRSFLKTEYKYLGIFAFVMAVLLSIALGIKIGITFIFGTILSALAGVVGMEIAVKANVRTANAAKKGGLSEAFTIAFRG
ncbi:MAG: sodium/proton-translocating pyrophosphatase, partial [archaeon]